MIPMDRVRENRMKMRIKVLGFLIILVAVAVLYFRNPQKASVTVVNQASKALKIVTVELCGESVTIENLAIQTSKKLELKVHGDCHYQVDAIFESGEKLSNGVGYVTHGLDFDDQILVTDSEIKMGEAKAH